MDRPLLFVHVPKTAGTSFRSLLREATRGRPFVEMPLREEGRRLASERLGPLDVVVGHVGYPLAAQFPIPPISFTFLRDPVDRAISNFSFLQRHPPSFPGVAEDEADFVSAAGMTLGGFLRECPEASSRHLGNLHVWFLTRDGLSPRGDLRTLGRADLDQAKRNLRSMDAFGLVERMAESLLVILSALRLPVSFLERMPLENRQEARLRTEDLDEAVLGALREACALDIELYGFARELFEERLEALRSWAASWLPAFWLSASDQVVSADRALAAAREEVLARLLAERLERDDELRRSADRRDEALAALAAAEIEARAKDAVLVRAQELDAECLRLREALERASYMLSAIRSASSWRTLETLRGVFGMRWNI